MHILQVKNLYLINNFEVLYNFDIYVYGAGYTGIQVKKLLSQIGLQINKFCDGDNSKWNHSVEGKPVISPLSLKKEVKNGEDVIILVASNFEDEIIQTMQEYEIKCSHIYTAWGLKYAIHLNLNSRRISQEYRDFYNKMFGITKYAALQTIRKSQANCLKSYYYSNESTIWILQPGKTASSSLSNTLSSQGIDIIQNHHMIYPYYRMHGELKKEWNAFRKTIYKKKMKIITAVREPISRDYSAFWQPFTGDEYEIPRTFYTEIMERDFQSLYLKFIDGILNSYESLNENIGVFTPDVWRDEFLWFDDELKEGVGVDIYQYPFERDKGYGLIQEGNKEILVLKVEQMEKNLDIIAQFVDKKELVMKLANIAAKKKLHWAYDELKENLVLPIQYVDHYYQNNNKMDYFYTQEEKEFFRKRWEKHIQINI